MGTDQMNRTPGLAGLAQRRADAQPFAVFLYIWGLEWLITSAIEFFDPGQGLLSVERGLLFAAILLTAAVLLWRSRSSKSMAAPRPRGRGSIAGPAAYVLALALLVADLHYAGGIDAFYAPLLKGVVLAAAYGWLSRWLGRPLVYLSLWMLALTVTVAITYLGFASVLLGGFGGLSMLALGSWLSLWRTLLYGKGDLAAS
ncbi:hypothetical protein [Paenibacillus cremeus]|uniref:Uncharacterized protein n=1 Tax=Paenibacillus cremeus TaxID=2163881 RepID=A0A559KDL0_9BACL|nr:hypothetical protein [Paenibacillus cremeus]TVY10199.1 hypothetical protein FPZ49_08985 [Paenibacillus cremeus]